MAAIDELRAQLPGVFYRLYLAALHVVNDPAVDEARLRAEVEAAGKWIDQATAAMAFEPAPFVPLEGISS